MVAGDILDEFLDRLEAELPHLMAVDDRDILWARVHNLVDPIWAAADSQLDSQYVKLRMERMLVAQGLLAANVPPA
jgi:hypothetical protein